MRVRVRVRMRARVRFRVRQYYNYLLALSRLVCRPLLLLLRLVRVRVGVRDKG